jgi:two-component system, NtrC family, response regulator AtoC
LEFERVLILLLNTRERISGQNAFAGSQSARFEGYRCMLDLTTLEPSALDAELLDRSVRRRRFEPHSPAMRELYRLVGRLAASPVPVVISGETGAGKEEIVRRLHEGSGREGPLCTLNCATIPHTLVTSTLFGHERGAFTGAMRSSRGVFEQADRGTLCLDEVAELPLEAQAALLRVLETRQITRVGAEQATAVDVRLLASSHRDLEAMVAQGQFRADLLYRLNTVTLRVPPLRERLQEIEPLAERFLDETLRARGAPPMVIDSEVRVALRRYPWPGNIRELRNAMQRAGTLGDGPRLRLEHLPEHVRVCRSPASGSGPDLHASFAQQVRDHEIALLREALRRTGGCKSEAAGLLRMPRRTLMRKIKLYGLGRVARAS